MNQLCLAAKCIIVLSSKRLMCSSAVRSSAGSAQWVFTALLVKQLLTDKENEAMKTVQLQVREPIVGLLLAQVAQLISAIAIANYSSNATEQNKKYLSQPQVSTK